MTRLDQLLCTFLPFAYKVTCRSAMQMSLQITSLHNSRAHSRGCSLMKQVLLVPFLQSRDGAALPLRIILPHCQNLATLVMPSSNWSKKLEVNTPWHSGEETPKWKVFTLNGLRRKRTIHDERG